MMLKNVSVFDVDEKIDLISKFYLNFVQNVFFKTLKGICVGKSIIKMVTCAVGSGNN